MSVKQKSGRNRNSQNTSHFLAQHSQPAQPILYTRKEKIVGLVSLLCVQEANSNLGLILDQSPFIYQIQ